MLTIVNSLEEAFEKGKLNKTPNMVIFDIDGTIAKGDLINNLFLQVLSEFNITHKDIRYYLGKQNFLNTEWLVENLSVDPIIANTIINKFKTLFLDTSAYEFKKELYDDVPRVFELLWKQKVIIGVFTLRNWNLAMHQIKNSDLEQFIYYNSCIPNGTHLKISGSGLSVKYNFQGFEEKLYQLKLHLMDVPNINPKDVIVVGNTIETDMRAASMLGLTRILIKRNT